MRQALINLEYQPYIDTPPVAPQQLYSQACTNDNATIGHWENIWISNIQANKARFGSFKNHGVGKLHAAHAGKACVLIGSGPSLKHNALELKNNKSLVVVSCLHNFHYLEDQDIHVDYYVSLDAGPVVIEEVSEGGTKPPDFYWERSKGKKLICFIGTDPKLFEKWQGEVYFFNAPVPSQSYMAKVNEIENFNTHISNGGNVLGACTYIAKGILGCNVTVFLGADFSFSYDSKFHGWDSKYDANMGNTVLMRDVFGIPVRSWQSYANFKAWFDWLAQSIPGIYINATEGGTFGAYNNGNIRSVIQMTLKQVLVMFQMHEELRVQCENPETPERKILF